jgi:hypothetical protein
VDPSVETGENSDSGGWLLKALLVWTNPFNILLFFLAQPGESDLKSGVDIRPVQWGEGKSQ